MKTESQLIEDIHSMALDAIAYEEQIAKIPILQTASNDLHDMTIRLQAECDAKDERIAALEAQNASMMTLIDNIHDNTSNWKNLTCSQKEFQLNIIHRMTTRKASDQPDTD